MKNQFTFLKVGLVGLFLMVGIIASAQTISVLTDFPTFEGDAGPGALNVKKVYCLNDGVTIPSESINGGTSTGLIYHWYRIDGSDYQGDIITLPSTIDGEAFSDQTITTPGYYIYRVSAENTETCESEVTEFMVYVLPNINVAITQTQGSDSYCENNIPTDAILTASAPTSAETVPELFAYDLEWFKDGVAISGETGSTIAFDSGTSSYNGGYTVKAKYVIAPTCTEGTSNSVTITETEAPTQPVITF